MFINTDTSIDNFRNQEGIKIPTVVCSTASGTAAKIITVPNTHIQDDTHLYVTMTNANTSATITLNANGLGDWDIYDLKGEQITGTYFNNPANETCLFKIDRTNSRFILVLAPFWMSRMASSSSAYIDLTLQASGSVYIAPADGYYFLRKTANGVNQFIYLENDSGIVQQFSITNNNNLSQVLKVRSGDTTLVSYNAGGTTDFFRFIYDEGAKP